MTNPEHGISNTLDEKHDVEHIDQEEFGQHMHIARKEAPPLVRDLTPEDKVHLEAKLRRKIDLRLMPMVIIMYGPGSRDRASLRPNQLNRFPGTF